MEVLNVSLPENGALTSEMEMEYDGFYNVNPLYNSTENFKVCNATAFLEKVILNEYSQIIKHNPFLILIIC